MAPRRRRNIRSTPASKSQEPSPEPSSETPTHVEENSNEEQHLHSGDDTCPACDANESPLNAAEKESWVRCDACKTWYHWTCAGDGGDLEAVDKW
jgi:F-box/leucine-rich repeat protein 10/11